MEEFDGMQDGIQNRQSNKIIKKKKKKKKKKFFFLITINLY